LALRDQEADQVGVSAVREAEVEIGHDRDGNEHTGASKSEVKSTMGPSAPPTTEIAPPA
jgi:hypothetical protein